MICYECGHQIKRDLAKFCDHCGSNLEIKLKKTSTQKEVVMKMEDEIDQAANLFVLWNSAIAAAFVFLYHSCYDRWLSLLISCSAIYVSCVLDTTLNKTP